LCVEFYRFAGAAVLGIERWENRVYSTEGTLGV
jgi:hypothetical protein